jgi:hypothetical protein
MDAGLIVAIVLLALAATALIFAVARQRRAHKLEERRVEAHEHREEAEIRSSRAERQLAQAQERAAKARREEALAREQKAAAEREGRFARERRERADQLDPDREQEPARRE